MPSLSSTFQLINHTSTPVLRIPLKSRAEEESVEQSAGVGIKKRSAAGWGHAGSAWRMTNQRFMVAQHGCLVWMVGCEEARLVWLSAPSCTVSGRNSATMRGHKPSLNKLIISHCFCSVLLLSGRAKDDVWCMPLQKAPRKDNGSANDVTLAHVDSCFNARQCMNIQRLCLWRKCGSSRLL